MTPSDEEYIVDRWPMVWSLRSVVWIRKLPGQRESVEVYGPVGNDPQREVSGKRGSISITPLYC